MTDYIKVSLANRICEIGIARPDKKNALNLEMYTAMADAIASATQSTQIRVVLLHGSSDCFTSGNDLNDFAQFAAHPELINSPSNPILRFMQQLQRCPKPVVCAVEGLAVGIGTTLLLHCDLVYCSAQASFALPFVNLGLCPEFAASELLPKLVGYPKAAEWLLLGDNFDAQQALQTGLVNSIEERPLEFAREQCGRLAIKPPGAVRATKKLLGQALQNTAGEALQNELREFALALQGPEFAEAVTAFLEKRAADFSQFN